MAVRKRRILLAEDSRDDLFLIQEALRSAQVDADIQIARDGDAAVKFFESADLDENAPRPDLVLLDLNLPKRNGEQVLKHLRQSLRCRHAQVLIVSSSDQPRDRAAVAEMSVAGYFKKPSSFNDFMKLGPIVKALLEEITSQ
jgi:DNA-binding response OmpR family regulator